jgi:hypothetical protein
VLPLESRSSWQAKREAIEPDEDKAMITLRAVRNVAGDQVARPMPETCQQLNRRHRPHISAGNLFVASLRKPLVF